MRLVVLGPPGAGKGTQCARVSRGFGLAHIGTGETLRQMARQDSALGREVRQMVEAGQLVDDATVVAAMVERIRREDARRGFLLDGFPRNRSQALALGAALGADGLWLDHAILLEVPDEVALKRLSGRVEDVETGKVYHTDFAPPPPGVEVQTRTGDTLTAQRRSLENYRAITQPMLQIYEDRDLLLRVDGTGTPDEVTARLSSAIGTIH